MGHRGSDKGVICTARVQVTIEITRGTWGLDCDLAQVYDQAGREAVEEVYRALGLLREFKRGDLRSAVVVGDPKVVAVIAKPE